MTLYVNSAQAVKHYHSVPTSPFNSINTINTSVSFNKFYNLTSKFLGNLLAIYNQNDFVLKEK